MLRVIATADHTAEEVGEKRGRSTQGREQVRHQEIDLQITEGAKLFTTNGSPVPFLGHPRRRRLP